MLLFVLFFGGFTLVTYIFTRLSLGITRSSTCLVGKTAIITGANSGLGYETALNFASRGCRVIMADVDNMEASKSNIIKYSSNTKIITKRLDLSSLQSVREFANDILASEERLDILVNNAGIGVTNENSTKDGLHPLIQINYFGHFLLTHLLIDLLKKSVPSRIVFTTSMLCFTNNLTLENLNFDNTKTALVSPLRELCIYGNSKLATIIASDIFAEKLKNTGVTSNSVHPGLVSTKIFKKCYDVCPTTLNWFTKFCVCFFSKDPWEGAQTLIHVAVSKKLERVTGSYFSDCKPFFKPLSAYNKKFCREIWEASESYVGLKPHERIDELKNK